MKHETKQTIPMSHPRRMPALLLAAALLLVGLLLPVGCTQTYVEEGGDSPAGSEAEACFYLNVLSSEQPVTRSLRMTADGTVETDSLPHTRATAPLAEAMEQHIRELWVAQYDASGTRLCTRYFPALDEGAQIDLKLVVTTSDCHIYFVANAGNLDAGSATEADFLDLSFAYRLTAEGLPADDNFVMKGEWTGTVDKGGVVGNIDLVRLLAKISLTYSMGGTDFSFTPTAVRLCNVPSHSRYMEPEGQIDGVTYGTYTSTQPAVAGDGTRTVYWYLPENRAGQATGDDAVSSVKQKTGRGVANATYIEICGTAVQSDVTYEDVSVRIYPGEDMNDYTVGRNCYYRQDIVLTGIDVTDERVTVGIVPGVTVEPGNMPAKKGGEKQVQVTARPGVEWFFELPEWLSAVIKGDTATYGNRVTYWGPEKVTFLAATANPHAASRSVDFIVAGETITITQDGAVLTAGGETSVAPEANATGSPAFTISEGLGWLATLNSEWGDWLGWADGAVTNEDEASSGSPRLAVKARSVNPSAVVRRGSIEIKGGDAIANPDYPALQATLSVVQQGARVEGSSVTVAPVAAEGLTGSFKATAGLPWDASVQTGGGWFALTGTVNGTTSGITSPQSVSFRTTAINTSSAQREGTIRIHAGNALDDAHPGPVGDIKVVQNGASLSVGAGGTLPAAASGGSSTFTATPGLSWAVAKDAAWLTLTSTSAGSNNATGSAQPVTYSAALNPTGSERTATITVKAGNAVTGTDNGLTRTIQVKQNPSVFSVSPTTVNSPGTGGSYNVTITATDNLPWNIVRTGDGNISANYSSSSGSKTVIITAPANPATVARTTYFTINETAGGSRSTVVTVTQAAGAQNNIVSGTLEIAKTPGKNARADFFNAITTCRDLSEDNKKWRLADRAELYAIVDNYSNLGSNYQIVLGPEYWFIHDDSGYMVTYYDNELNYWSVHQGFSEEYHYYVCVTGSL